MAAAIMVVILTAALSWIAPPAIALPSHRHTSRPARCSLHLYDAVGAHVSAGGMHVIMDFEVSASDALLAPRPRFFLHRHVNRMSAGLCCRRHDCRSVVTGCDW